MSDNLVREICRLGRERDEACAEADLLRDALQAIAAECSFAPESENNATVRWVLHTARAALDAEDGDGLAEVARISADADLYRKTDGVVIRREDGSA